MKSEQNEEKCKHPVNKIKTFLKFSSEKYNQ